MLKCMVIGLTVLWWTAVACGQSAPVEYNIKARVIPDSAIVRGELQLRYENRSDSPLGELFFQIDMNATQAGGMMERRYLLIEDSTVYKMDQAARGYCRIDGIRYNGELLPQEKSIIDNTILKIALPQALLPNDTASVVIDFESRAPTGERGKDVSTYLSFIGWYPRLCAYRAGKWHFGQYLGWNVVPGEFADYRVELEIDTAFAIAHTGCLLNNTEHYGFVSHPDSPAVLVDFVKRSSRDSLGGPFTARFNAPVKKYIIEAENEMSFAFVVADSLIRDRIYTDHTMIEVCYNDASKKRFADSVACYGRDLLSRFQPYPGQFPYQTLTVVAGDTTDLQSPSASLIIIPGRTKNRQAIKSALAVHIVSHLLPRALFGSDDGSWMFPDGLSYYTAAIVLGCDDNYEGLGKYEDLLKKSFAWHMYRKDRKVLDPYKRTVVIEDTLMAQDMHALADYVEYRFRRYPAELYMLRFLVGDQIMREAATALVDSGRYTFGNRHEFDKMIQNKSPEDVDWFFSAIQNDSLAYDCALTDVKVGQEPDQWTVEYKIENFGSFLMPVEIGFVSAAADTLYDTLALADLAGEQTSWWLKTSLDLKPVAMVLDPNHYLPDTNRYNNYWFDMPIRYKYQDPKSLFIGYRKY